MTQAKEKRKKIGNTLRRHEEAFNEKLGTSLINDFMQLSQILESLKETDPKAFNAFYALILKNLELDESVRERGKRIAKLSIGRTQPK